jgi:hypothetical protein
MPVRVVPEVMALIHPDAQTPPGTWPHFSDEASGCEGEIIVHLGNDEGRQWIECFGTCDLASWDEARTLHHVSVSRVCASGLADELGVTFLHPCDFCRTS